MEEALDLSFDRLLMMMNTVVLKTISTAVLLILRFTVVVDFLCVNLHLGVFPPWSGFPGNPDHPSSS